MPKGPERDLEVINQAPESIQSILRELENVPSSGSLAREAALKVSEAVVKSLEERSDFEVWGIIKELGDWIFSPDLQRVSDGLRAYSIMYFAGAHHYLITRWVKPPEETRREE